MTAVQEGVGNMERALKRRGYMKIDSKVERKIDDKEKMVDLVISLDPGPQYRMGTLVIEGLDIETEPHIRKMWALKSNQPFDNEYPDLFLSKMPEVLDSLGKTRAVVKPDPGTLKVDVTLHFEGEKKEPEKPKL
jgi:outer membrane protein assembly factor BamA